LISFFSMELLYCDDQILAINKPAGVLTIPDGYDKILPNLKQLLDIEYGKVWTVHRLDKETSGVVLFALSAAAHKSLSIQFEKREIKKTYLALVHGTPQKEMFVIDEPLKVNGDRSHRTVPDHVNGKKALTNVKIITRFESYTMIEASPETGYTHQIRSHLLSAGYPIVNDSLYGIDSSRTIKESMSGRLMLHAKSICFWHPVLLESLTIEAPTPTAFTVVIDKIKQES